MSRAEAEDFFFALLAREAAQRGADLPEESLRAELSLTVAREAHAQDGTTSLTFDLAQRLSDLTIELDAETGALFSYYLDFLAAGGDRSLPEDEALALATAIAAPPPGAVLERAGYEARGPRIMYRARFRHEADGLPVEGDFIEVLVNGKNRRAFALTRRWRTPRLG
ncbi:MAG: hypothetical protein U0359_06575 [Byssovorax sp.]